jgi:hypothetical protein
VSADSLKQ